MKNKALLIAFLSVAAFAMGCNKDQTTSDQLDKVQAKTQQAAQDVKDRAFAQKRQFVEKMQTQLAALNRDSEQICGPLAAIERARRDRQGGLSPEARELQ